MMQTRLLAFVLICTGTVALADDELPEDEGRDIVEYACTQCHDLYQVTQARKTPRQWEYLVNQMINQGAPIEDHEVETVVRYLATHFGAE
ncbi:MAG: hypothetical protein R3176_07660 [Woeseiaceae bacterium]|nr:hypothetical protein [Woeseiaceae bacterium]